MTRRFLDDIRADVNAGIITNGVGSITALVLNPLMIDTIDSCIADEAKLRRDAEQLTVPLTAAYTTPIVYDYSEGGDGSFLIVNEAAGTITSSATPGFSYGFALDVVIIGALNARYDMSGLIGGVAQGFVTSGTGEGANDPITLHLGGTSLSTPASGVLELGLKTDSPGNITIVSAAMRLDILPTNNASASRSAKGL
jgi:hypothetical protein